MLSATELLLYALTVVLLVLSPGPNMLYFVSRAITQGPWAGVVSVLGMQTGNVVYFVATALGLTALIAAWPVAFDLIKWAGAAYLLWLAWQAFKPGGRALFETRALPHDTVFALFRMGLITNLLSPKQMVFFMSIVPQCIHPDREHVHLQMLQLLVVHLIVGTLGNSLIACSAGSLSRLLKQYPAWLVAQRYVMGGLLAGLALKLVFSERRA